MAKDDGAPQRQRPLPDASGAVAASFAICAICEQQRRDPDRRGTKPGRLTPRGWGGNHSQGQYRCCCDYFCSVLRPRAWVKPGAGVAAEVAWSKFRATRTEAREPKTRRTDAFPRPGAAGPGCLAATVADGRRVTKTGAARWRKSAC